MICSPIIAQNNTHNQHLEATNSPINKEFDAIFEALDGPYTNDVSEEYQPNDIPNNDFEKVRAPRLDNAQPEDFFFSTVHGSFKSRARDLIRGMTAAQRNELCITYVIAKSQIFSYSVCYKSTKTLLAEYRQAASHFNVKALGLRSMQAALSDAYASGVVVNGNSGSLEYRSLVIDIEALANKYQSVFNLAMTRTLKKIKNINDKFNLSKWLVDNSVSKLAITALNNLSQEKISGILRKVRSYADVVTKGITINELRDIAKNIIALKRKKNISKDINKELKSTDEFSFLNGFGSFKDQALGLHKKASEGIASNEEIHMLFIMHNHFAIPVPKAFKAWLQRLAYTNAKKNDREHLHCIGIQEQALLMA
ncbi:hypothetical protein [Photobacterium leiognathi]|uniref:hypothetical protein n=1 Tax=Photobacterium leiognathi TaxID=553611 RepID=UPI002980A88D|nr:hypothetical protein [Photobacterium leiognathi]